MTIVKERQNDSLILRLEGRLETGTADKLQEAIEQESEGLIHLTIDMTQLTYLTSAGLRVLLRTKKRLQATGGDMVLTNVNKDIMEVFGITGFDDILTIR